jgi:YtkA-like
MKHALVIASAAAATVAGASGHTVTSQHGRFGAVVERPRPVPVGRLHSWRVHLTTKAGRPVVGARIAIWGDMPAHGHGLPTQPRARELGRGAYSLDGLKFQMGGAWVVELTVSARGVRDVIRIRFPIP